MAKTLRIAAMSVAVVELEQIKSLIASLRGDVGANWEWVTDSTTADVILIDADSLYGHMDWLKAQSQGRNVICLTASNGHEQDNVLHRPIGVGGLKASLMMAAGGCRDAAADAPVAPEPAVPAPRPAVITAPQPAVAAVAPTPKPAPAPVPTPAAVAVPMPEPVALRPAPVAPPAPVAAPATMALIDYFLSENLADARKLERDGQPPLIIDAAADRYYGGLTLKPLLPYCMGAIKANEWKPLPAAEIEKLRAVNAGLPLSRLLWLYIIGTSNGSTMLPGLDLNAKFKLVKWPQIEREFPKHFRIGTAMMKGPSTLSEIADGSGATVGEVIDFVNAYAAIGFAVQDGGTPISDRRALIERLRNRAV